MTPLVLALVSSRHRPSRLLFDLSLLGSLPSPCLLSPFLSLAIAVRLDPYLPCGICTEQDLREVFRSLYRQPRLISMLPRGFDVPNVFRVLLLHFLRAYSDFHPTKHAYSDFHLTKHT